MEPRRRRGWPGLVAAGAVVAGALYLLHGPVAVWYVRGAIAGATSTQEEEAALCRANHWVHAGYTPTYGVRTFDAGGAEIRPWQDGNYDAVATVRLTWSDGQTVERRLLSTHPLGCVFGE